MIQTRRSKLPVQDCCRLLGVCRATAYRKALPVPGLDPELERLAGEYPRFGYRRLAVMMGTTPKKMRVAMSRHGLMAKRKRRKVRTTFPVPVDAVNLCRVPQAAGELLVSDFTYVPLIRGFAYFAITLDVFTRRIRGWAVGKTMSSDFAVQALHMAIESGPLAPGWVHHSDRGSQYASAEFRNLVRNFHGISSFSRPAKPSDNPFAESFFSRFKDEVLYIQESLNYQEAYQLIQDKVSFYNEARPHSSLGDLSPMTYERMHAEQPLP